MAIDNKVVNTEKIKETAYQHSPLSQGNHTRRINTWYAGAEKSAEGEATIFTIGTSAIDGVAAADVNIHLSQGTNYLQVEGEGIQSVSLFNASGTVMAKASGNAAAKASSTADKASAARLDISSLTPGVYIVQIKTAQGDTTRRIIVSR